MIRRSLQRRSVFSNLVGIHLGPSSNQELNDILRMRLGDRSLRTARRLHRSPILAARLIDVGTVRKENLYEFLGSTLRCCGERIAVLAYVGVDRPATV